MEPFFKKVKEENAADGLTFDFNLRLIRPCWCRGASPDSLYAFDATPPTPPPLCDCKQHGFCRTNVRVRAGSVSLA